MFENSRSFLINFDCIKSVISIHIEIIYVIAYFTNGLSENLSYRLKNDEYSDWNFSEDRENPSRFFNGLCIDVNEMKSDLKSFKIIADITKLDSDNNNCFRCVNKDIVEFFIDCDKVTSSDEVFTTVSLQCWDSQLTLECRILTIYPLILNSDIDLDRIVSYSIEKRSETYKVGHRGLGSETGLAVLENTIYGFNRCAELNMDFVELDVHFSKDGEIVVFHDFFMDKDYRGKKDEIKQLTYQEIHEQLGPRSVTGIIPTLDEVLSEVSDNIGMLLEFKYPLLMSDGKRENHHKSNDPGVYYMHKNDYVDKILNVVFRNLTLKARKLVLISFEPDICLLLKLKQDLFPVFCITRGALLPDTLNHADSRMFHYDNAVSWAQFCGLNGIISRYHEVLKDNYKSLRDCPLLTFLYGTFPRDEPFYRNGPSNGIDGLIIDDVEGYLKIIQSR